MEVIISTIESCLKPLRNRYLKAAFIDKRVLYGMVRKGMIYYQKPDIKPNSFDLSL